MHPLSMDTGPKRGILKKDSSVSASRGRAIWNEANLAENEQIKAELNTTKIDEPKTPYHAPADADIDMEPLDLNDSDAVQPAPPEPDAKACIPVSSTQAGSSAPTAVRIHMDPFQNSRKQHYNMKDALKRGKALLEEEEEEEQDN